jgi:hypothetical protein
VVNVDIDIDDDDDDDDDDDGIELYWMELGKEKIIICI